LHVSTESDRICEICVSKCFRGKEDAIKADATDVNAVRGAVKETIETFGGIDILVNNAGVIASAPIEEFSIEDFDRLVAVNVKSLFVATKEAVRHMRTGGRIIQIGSCNSLSVPLARDLICLKFLNREISSQFRHNQSS
jgi:NAD(P)-dependent dehydrogenase (short-subunit alcohol dehydrogenase family)